VSSVQLLQVHHLRSTYFVRSAAYVALVAAMKQAHTLSASEQQSLALFKRLDAGPRALPLGAPGPHPPRFTVAKLRKLEGRWCRSSWPWPRRRARGCCASPRGAPAVAKALAAVRLPREAAGGGQSGVWGESRFQCRAS